MNATTMTSSPRHTPGDHAACSTLKPVKVLEATNTGEYGPRGLIEFEGGFTRIIDLPTHKDAHHLIFDSLDWPDKHKLQEAAALVVPVGHGIVKVYRTCLSFVSIMRNKRGQWLSSNCFDVPDENHAKGTLTGYKAALELLDAMQTGVNFYGTHSMGDMLIEAGAATGLYDGKTPSRYWAAQGFFQVIEAALRGAAMHTNYTNYIDRLESAHIDTVARLNDHLAVLTSQRIAKSVATRKARAMTRAPNLRHIPR